MNNVEEGVSPSHTTINSDFRKVAHRASSEGGTEATTSVTESIASSHSLPGQDLSHSIRTVIKSRLDPAKDANKIKLITAIGKSIKFPVKLMYILEECKQFESIVSWSQDGLSFIIHDSEKFEETVLPFIFKDAMFNSFLRKLYRWGFTKRNSEGRNCSYINANFQRGNYSLCMEMSCANKSQVSSNRLRQEIEAARVASEATSRYNETINRIENLRQTHLLEQLIIQQQQQQQTALMHQMADLIVNNQQQQALYRNSYGTPSVQGILDPIQMQMMNNNAAQNSLLQQHLQLNASALSHSRVQQVPLPNHQFPLDPQQRMNFSYDQNRNNDANGGMWRRGGNYF